jgi:hypothetical protein
VREPAFADEADEERAKTVLDQMRPMTNHDRRAALARRSDAVGDVIQSGLLAAGWRRGSVGVDGDFVDSKLAATLGYRPELNPVAVERLFHAGGSLDAPRPKSPRIP